MAKSTHRNILNSSEGTTPTDLVFKTNFEKHSTCVLALIEMGRQSFAPKKNAIGRSMVLEIPRNHLEEINVVICIVENNQFHFREIFAVSVP